MSEIKGQLLGVLLVLVLFTAIGATVYKMFNDTSKTVSNKASTAATYFDSGE